MEVVFNGNVILTSKGSKAVVAVPIPEPGWLAVRCFGPAGETIRYAHSSPFYFPKNGKMPVHRADAERWATYIHKLAAVRQIGRIIHRKKPMLKHKPLFGRLRACTGTVSSSPCNPSGRVSTLLLLAAAASPVDVKWIDADGVDVEPRLTRTLPGSTCGARPLDVRRRMTHPVLKPAWEGLQAAAKENPQIRLVGGRAALSARPSRCPTRRRTAADALSLL